MENQIEVEKLKVLHGTVTCEKPSNKRAYAGGAYISPISITLAI